MGERGVEEDVTCCSRINVGKGEERLSKSFLHRFVVFQLCTEFSELVNLG